MKGTSRHRHSKDDNHSFAGIFGQNCEFMMQRLYYMRSWERNIKFNSVLQFTGSKTSLILSVPSSSLINSLVHGQWRRGWISVIDIGTWVKMWSRQRARASTAVGSIQSISAMWTAVVYMRSEMYPTHWDRPVNPATWRAGLQQLYTPCRLHTHTLLVSWTRILEKFSTL